MDRLTDPGPFPKVILLDTISHCNLRCPNCGFRLMSRKKGRMGWHLFRKLVSEIAATELGTRLWMVFFGEGLLLRDQLYRMIRHAKDSGLQDVVLNTNGVLLDADARHGLMQGGLDAVYIGIDAITPATYKKVRVGGNYDTVLCNTLALIREKELSGSERPDVYVQFVVMEENEDERDDFVEYWQGQGVKVKVRPKVTFAGATGPYGLQGDERYPCHWQMQTMSILWDGRAAHCACDWDGKGIYGDVSRDSIASVWASMRWLREAHERGKWEKLPEFCQQCTDWQMARAGYAGDNA